MRTPGTSRIDRRKRKPMAFSYPYGAQTNVAGATTCVNRATAVQTRLFCIEVALAALLQGMR
jgi:hypothetical protein